MGWTSIRLDGFILGLHGSDHGPRISGLWVDYTNISIILKFKVGGSYRYVALTVTYAWSLYIVN